MTIFESLLLAHLVGDWLLQNEWQAIQKGKKWQALISHVLVYHIVVLAVLVVRFGAYDLRVYITVAILAVTHTLLDMRRSVEWYIRTFRLSASNPPELWLVIVVDQSIHLILLGLAALYLSR
jgi:hypothetical protein